MANTEQEQQFSQHQKRVIIIEALYQYFLSQKDESELEKYLIQTQKNQSLNAELVKIIKDIIWYQTEIEAKIQNNLKTNWSFNNLKPTEKSILFLATYEILYTKTQKAIIINEAVILAKQYCDNNAYKYINGVLDKINSN